MSEVDYQELPCENLQFFFFLRTLFHNFRISFFGTSLVVRWLRLHLAMQGTRVRSLVWEDPTSRGATKPMHHS